MSAFLGTAFACVTVAISSLMTWQRPGAGYLLAGSLLYVVGTMLVTIVFNVPRNDALAIVEPAAVDGRVWTEYVASWTAWNHVRAAAALASAALLTIGLCLSETAKVGM